MQNAGIVLLVDEDDRPLQVMDKMEAHQQGILHRAFSVFVFQLRASRPYLLLQKRAAAKYHFGGLWTNTCCGHPLDGETPARAGERRLNVEMNISCELRPVGHFIYRAQSANGLYEHEYDHVLVGTYDGELVEPNSAEADAARWISLPDLERELATEGSSFTPWFAPAYQVIKASKLTLPSATRDVAVFA